MTKAHINNFTFAEVVTGGTYHSINGHCYIRDIYKLKLSDFEGTAESHISLFRFPSEFMDFYKQNKTISNYNGLVHCGKYIIADFDSAKDVETSRQDLISFCQYLETFLEEPEMIENIPIYFSGNKGFNIYFPVSLIGEIEPSKNLHIRVKKFFETIANNIYEETGHLITTLDYAIYDKIHLIRIPNSLNTKGNLHKIPLLYSELINLDIQAIKEMAIKPRHLKYSELKENPELRKMFFQDITDLKKETKTATSGSGLNLNPVNPGERNKTLLNNANKLRYKNIAIEEAKAILTLWNDSLPEPIPEKEFNTTVESAFRYETKEKISIIDRSSFSNFEDRKKKYADMMKDVHSKTVRTGYNLIDFRTRGIRAGEICLLTAVTGIGKSAITQNILMNFCKANPSKTALYFSLEMQHEEIHEREIQISEGIAGYEVENFSKDIKGLNNFVTVTEPLTAELIPLYIDRANEYFNEVSFCVLDHSGLIDGRGTDDYAKISNAMRTIKQIAMKYRIPFLIISQINRISALNKDERISLFSAKSSGELENSSSHVLALEKINSKNYKLFGYGTEIISPDIISGYDDNKISLLILSLLKNRRGALTQSILEMERKTLRISESDLNKKVIDEETKAKQLKIN